MASQRSPGHLHYPHRIPQYSHWWPHGNYKDHGMHQRKFRLAIHEAGCPVIHRHLPHSQQTKNDHCRSPGLLCLLPIPTRPWEDLSLDFIVGLPPSQGHTTMLVMVDSFSKGIHIGILPTHCTATIVAKIFMETTRKIHGMPRSLVFDHDPLFMS